MSTPGHKRGAVSFLGGQMLARLLTTGLRFGLAAFIIQAFGVGEFGQYALVLSILLLGETLLDYGLTDWAARALSIGSGKKRGVLRSMLKARACLLPVAALLMTGVAAVLARNEGILAAVGVVLPGLVVYAGILYYRSLLKAAMRMDLEVGSELLGVILSLPLYWWTWKAGGGLAGLMASYLFSRIAFLGMVAFLARSEFRKPEPGESGSVRTVLREVSPLGLSMMLVCLHTTLDPIMVAAFLDKVAVGLLAGSQRILFLMLLLTIPLSDALLPVLARSFSRDDGSFAETVRRGGVGLAFLSGGLFAGFFSGSEFLLGLLGSDMQEANTLFRILCVACLLKGTALIAGPALLAAARFKTALILTASLVLFKLVALGCGLYFFGLSGAGFALVAGEIANVGASLMVVRRITGQPMGAPRLLGIAAAALISVIPVCFFDWDGGFVAGCASGVIFLLLCVSTGLFDRGYPGELRVLLGGSLNREGE